LVPRLQGVAMTPRHLAGAAVYAAVVVALLLAMRATLR
jgi:hypothetical protein